jgi:hypothetical protein
VAEAVLSNNIDIEKDQLVLEALEAEAVSSDLEPTRDAIFGEIGTVQFPELMMEVNATRDSVPHCWDASPRHGKSCCRFTVPCWRTVLI